jgi:hypothetical protein
MKLSKQWSTRHLNAIALVALVATYAVAAEPSTDKPQGKVEESKNVAVAEQPANADDSPALVAAKKQARLMHDIYSATLDSMHHHYFHENKSILPARAMEDIFDELSETSKLKSNWIAVNTNAMSVNHEPKTDFEIKAAAALRTGQEKYEAVENGYYFRAGPISLGAGCVSCHTGFFSAQPKTPRLAGLIIGIPLEEK